MYNLAKLVKLTELTENDTPFLRYHVPHLLTGESRTQHHRCIRWAEAGDVPQYTFSWNLMGHNGMGHQWETHRATLLTRGGPIDDARKTHGLPIGQHLEPWVTHGCPMGDAWATTVVL